MMHACTTMQLCVYAIVVCVLQLVAVCTANNKELHIGGIFPMTGGWAGGKGCRPAVDMALEDVNKHPTILKGFTLNMVANDSMCMPGLGMNVLYELLYNPPSKLMLLGPGCSVVSTFVGQAARMWNLIVLSYGSSSPALSNRDRFPTFFRTHPSATLHNPTRVKLFQKFKWTRIATIQETQEVFTSTIEDLEERVKQAGVEIAVRTSFLTDPTNAVRNLKRQDARIIVGLFYEDMARRVFCEVHKQKMYGPKYVWLIIGWYPDNWYKQHDPSINCTVAEMQEALEGHFTTEGLMLNQDNSLTESGMTSQQFINRIEKRIGGSDPLSVTGYVEAPLAYDAVWALALALNKTQARLMQNNQSLEQFDYSNEKIMQEIYAAMNSSDFLGVSGRVAFNSEGDRIAWTQVEQMLNGNYNKVGFYDIGSDNLTWFDNEKWPRDKLPQDRTIVVPVLRMVSQALFISMSLLASIGIGAAVSLLVFNVKYGHRRYIKMSQPHINNVMLLGCIVCLSCIYLEGLDGRYVSEQVYSEMCQIRPWIMSFGFTLAYGSLFSKVWCIYRMTTQRKKESKVLKVFEMYLVIAVMLTADIVLLTVWQILDPLERELESFAHQPSDDLEKDIEIKPQLEHCKCTHRIWWLGILFATKGVILLFGILLAYETRNVKIKQVNDSRFVGMSIYNIVVLCIITAPVTVIISSHQDACFAFIAVAIILSSFLAMGLIFVPKLLEVLQHPRDGAESAALTDSNPSREEEERHNRLMGENNNLKQQIAEKEEKIKDLNVQLEKRSAAVYKPTSGNSSASGVCAEEIECTRYSATRSRLCTTASTTTATTSIAATTPTAGGTSSHAPSSPNNELLTTQQHDPHSIQQIPPSQHIDGVDSLVNVTHDGTSPLQTHPLTSPHTPATDSAILSCSVYASASTRGSSSDTVGVGGGAVQQDLGGVGASGMVMSPTTAPGNASPETLCASDDRCVTGQSRRRSDPDEIYSESYC